MNLKIHHVALTVQNMDETIAWYEKVFDARTIERYAKHGLEIAHVEFGNVRVEFFAGEEVKPLPEYRKTVQDDIRTIGTKHMCFETNDLDGLVKILDERGVEFATKPDTTGFGGRYVFIKDPNGILIELYQKPL